MSSVAVVALATPAFALPDRYEQGYSCTGLVIHCMQDQLQQEDGNRSFEKSGTTASGTGANGGLAGASFAGAAGDDDDLNDEVGDFADEAGDEVAGFADEAGDEISDTADDVGDAIGDAFD